MTRPPSTVHATVCLAALLAALGGHAHAGAAPGCKRTIVVASSQVGRAMTIGPDNTVRGAVKDFLDLVSRRTGCTFSYVPVARSQAWIMVEWGRADIMPAAVQNHARDQFAQFIPTHQVRPMLLTLDRNLPAIATTTELLQAGLRVGVVRGYDFGPAYRALVDGLQRQGRLQAAADPHAIASLLRNGRIQAALLPPAAFADAGEAQQLARRLQWRELGDLPRVPIGFYLSTTVLDDADRAILHEAIRQAVAGDAYARAMRQHYPPWALQDVSGN